MKKFFKFLLGTAAAIAVIGSILYFFKNILMRDYLEDYDDDDFDNDLYDEDDRDYVTINTAPESDDSDDDSADKTDSSAETDSGDDTSVYDSITD